MEMLCPFCSREPLHLCTPWLRCSCLVRAPLSPDPQILGMCTMGVEEVEMVLEEDRLLKVTWCAEGGDEER